MGTTASSYGPIKSNLLISDCQFALAQCKWSLGIAVSDPYPQSYDGRCEEAEHDLKKAISFHLDSRAARVLYDPTAPREARVEANKQLQPKLARHRWVSSR